MTAVLILTGIIIVGAAIGAGVVFLLLRNAILPPPW
jgi:hypothetical protein